MTLPMMKVIEFGATPQMAEPTSNRTMAVRNGHSHAALSYSPFTLHIFFIFFIFLPTGDQSLVCAVWVILVGLPTS